MDEDVAKNYRLGKKQSKSELVYNYLLDGIMSGVWDPGERINDKEIAETLGINRLAVREALSRLIENDVVEQLHWKGYHVRSITQNDVMHIVDIRISLESLAIKQLLQKTEEHKLQYFSKMQETIEKQELFINNDDHASYLEVDFHFHELLYEASENPLIGKIIGNFRIMTNLLRNVSMGKKPEDFREAAYISTKDHQEMLDAMMENNYSKTKKLLTTHLGKTFVGNITKNLKIVKE
jgi:DNA-binding GntR family transcriptional regulator